MKRNPNIQPKKLAEDWPHRFKMEIKDEAAQYVSDLRGPWPVPDVLRERAVRRLMKKFDRDVDSIEADESWWDRWESAGIEQEIEAALEYYKDEMWSALEKNPALPPFEPVEVEQIRADMQAAIGAVAERYGLRVQYSELAPTEKVIPVGFKIYRRAPEQRDLFGNPQRANNPRQTRQASRISRGGS